VVVLSIILKNKNKLPLPKDGDTWTNDNVGNAIKYLPKGNFGTVVMFNEDAFKEGETFVRCMLTMKDPPVSRRRLWRTPRYSGDAISTNREIIAQRLGALADVRVAQNAPCRRGSSDSVVHT